MPDTLFSQSYLDAGLKETEEYKQINNGGLLAAKRQEMERPYKSFASNPSGIEAQVEDRLIRPILNSLGWSYLPQQTIPGTGRTPDYMLFANDEERAAVAGGADVSQHALSLAEAKAWNTDLDKRIGSRSPADQLQEYLTLFWQTTNGRAKWGIVTNGETWRLYRVTGPGPDNKFYKPQDTWLEVNLADCLKDGGQEQRKRLLLFFHRDSFLIRDDGYCFLDLALAEASEYAKSVVDQLSSAVFSKVYPQIVAAFYQAAPQATPEEIQEASLTLLYRLLFLMYAEDRRLLPTDHPGYSTISLRSLRQDILERLNANPAFIPGVVIYWPRLQALFQRIDAGEPYAILPPYNGGLFSGERPELLSQVSLSDESIAHIINNLGTAADNGGTNQALVNFRDLSVGQLGTLYESLLERRPVIRNGQVEVRLQPLARKDSGSYYTPPELVDLIVEQSLEPLVRERMDRFRQLSQSLASDSRTLEARRKELSVADPAQVCLELKILDPAMGSGHFLVAALDYLTKEVDRLIGDAAEIVHWLPADNPYVSPLQNRIENIRNDIVEYANTNGWRVNQEHITDGAIIRRIVLKRCLYGVDLNPLSVELAKMSLWLHSFTEGSPLSFLDHHLRCGDSLVGAWLSQTNEDIRATAPGFFANTVFASMNAAAAGIQEIEQINDFDIAAVKESAQRFGEMTEVVQPVRRMLNFFAGLRWLGARSSDKPLPMHHPRQLRRRLGQNPANGLEWWLSHDYDVQLDLLRYGPDVIPIKDLQSDSFDLDGFSGFSGLWQEAQELAAQRRMFHWELDFPGVFDQWTPRRGGFDAVIGNPPWERVKLQEVEWFQPSTRRPEIAAATPAARRRAMITQLEAEGDPLYQDYTEALQQSDTMIQYGQASGDYPLLGGGDTNLYRLFVERAASLVNSDGIVALLTPSGIYGDLSAAGFFSRMAEAKRLLALYDFENRRGSERPRFFPDVHPQFKFCLMTMGGTARTADELPAGFLLHDPPKNTDADRLVTLRASDFALVNPETGTSPIFLNRREADIVLGIYRDHPVLDAENKKNRKLAAVVRHVALAHMTNDSGQFRSSQLLERDGWYAVDPNRYRRGNDVALPLYQGRMIHHFDHRFNSVRLSPGNVNNPYTNIPVTDEQHHNPSFFAKPQYWVGADFVRSKFPEYPSFAIGFRLITRTTDERTLIATIVPWAGYGNSLPILIADSADAAADFTDYAPLWAANFSSFAMDFVARRKLQGTNMNWYILRQLPVIARASYERRFGDITAEDLVRNHVLRLCYTARDLRPFAQAQGYEGEPYGWDGEERRHLRARLDALYFLLYGLDRDDAGYILDSFPITRSDDEREHNGVYLTKELILGYMNALSAGDTETVITVRTGN